MTAESNGNNLVIQGRIVWGTNLFEGKQKLDYNTSVPVIGTDGNPVMEYGFGLAVPKNDSNGQPSENFSKIWNALHQEAYTLYPSGQLPPDFAMKYKDGDAIDHNGKPFADREGYAGHIILTCTTQIPIKWFIYEGGNNILVNTGIKVGDYIDAQLNIKAHPAKGKGKAGLYLNPGSARLVQSGPEIINSPSGDQIFGAAAPAAYAGALPAGNPTPMPMNSQAPMGAPAMPQAAQPAQQQAPVAPQAPAQVAPHYGVLPQAHQPAQQQAPVAPQMPQAQPVQQAPQAPVAPVGAPQMPPAPPMPQ